MSKPNRQNLSEAFERMTAGKAYRSTEENKQVGDSIYQAVKFFEQYYARGRLPSILESIPISASIVSSISIPRS